MCYVHNQWYDISCATLYFSFSVVGHRNQNLLMQDDSETYDSKDKAPEMTISLREAGARMSKMQLLNCEIYLFAHLV